MRPLYIFDLDGTLALIDHRRHYVENHPYPAWNKFYEACDKDLPNESVITVMESLRRFADVWIFSGRSAKVKEKTITWLASHTSFLKHEIETILTMRQEDDFTPDEVLKERWLNNMLIDDRRRLVAVFDDRDKVVDMWRKNEVACFQVAPGNF